MTYETIVGLPEDRAAGVCAYARNRFDVPNVPLKGFAAQASGPFSCIIGWFGKATIRPSGRGPLCHRPTVVKLQVGRAMRGGVPFWKA
jgi:hypothetical protein